MCALIPKLFGAPEHWIKIETPHFELYTTAGEKKGREAILYFEQVRSFFLEASPSKRAPEFPMRIVAFRSENQYKPYRMNEGSVAYYANGRFRDYIVMEDLSSEHYPTAIHEYTHLIVHHAGLNFPVWLNEGWADVYSSLTPKGNKVLIGGLLPGRVQTLLTTKWIDLSVLASVGLNSPMYNERNKAGIFYAESWLLVHMLYLSPDYRPKFTQLLLAVNSGQDTAAAFQSVYGKGLKEVMNDLQLYIRSDRFYGELLNVKLEKSAEEPQVSDATPFESGLVLADLLALLNRPEEARQAYTQLAKDDPGSSEVEESLGYLEWQQGRPDLARQDFSRAFQAATKNAQMCFDYAMLEWQQHPGGKEAIPILRRAVELKPDYVAARLQLGLALANQQSFAEAADQLHQIKKINPEQAPAYFLALAYCDLQLGHSDLARQNAESAKKWSKTKEDSERADSLLRGLDALQNAKTQPTVAGPPVSFQSQPATSEPRDNAGPPTLHRSPVSANLVQPSEHLTRAEGTAERLDCNGKSARLTVTVNHSRMVFEIPDPARVQMKHAGEAHHDFTCGPQKPFPVVVYYAENPGLKQGVAGIVRQLEF